MVIYLLLEKSNRMVNEMKRERVIELWNEYKENDSYFVTVIKNEGILNRLFDFVNFIEDNIKHPRRLRLSRMQVRLLIELHKRYPDLTIRNLGEAVGMGPASVIRYVYRYENNYDIPELRS